MDLAQLANIGEFVGGLAVIASLFYVGVQIRQTRTVLIRSSERDWYRDNTNAVMHASHDEAMADLWVRGMGDYRSLTAEETWRFDVALYSWLAGFERASRDRRVGLGDAETAATHEATIKQVLQLPGAADWWDERRYWFNASFQEEVARLRADELPTSHTSLVRDA